MADPLLHALAGTARLRGPVTTATPADDWLSGTDEERVLRALAVHTATRAARPATIRPLPEPAPVEVLPELSAAGAAALLRVQDDADLLAEALTLVAARGRVLPPELVPRLHDKAELGAVLGARGRWILTHLAPPGAQATDAWTDGRRAERLAWLERTRRADPGAARAAVQAVFASEPADLRAAMLTTFAVGLSVEDEPFLLTALSDRAPSVRRAAAERLATLPTLGARLQERAAALVAAKFTLPDPLPADWARDGAEGSKVQDRLRAVVSLIDPAVWPDLDAMVRDKAWGDVLRPALVDAAALHRSRVAERIFPLVPSPKLLPHLRDPHEAVRPMVPLRNGLVAELLVALPAPWPGPLASIVMANLKLAFTTRGAWPEAALVAQRARIALPVEAADALADTALGVPALARLKEALDLRRGVRAALI